MGNKYNKYGTNKKEKEEKPRLQRRVKINAIRKENRGKKFLIKEKKKKNLILIKLRKFKRQKIGGCETE
jgi:hypothetical protein